MRELRGKTDTQPPVMLVYAIQRNKATTDIFMGEKVGMASYSGILVPRKVSRVDVNQSRDGLRQSCRSSIPKLSAKWLKCWLVIGGLGSWGRISCDLCCHGLRLAARGSRLSQPIGCSPESRKMVVWGIRPPDPPEMAETLKFQT